MNTTAAQILTAAFSAEPPPKPTDPFAARPPVLDDSGPDFTRPDARDPTEEFAPWTAQHARIPESPAPWPMMCVLLALWAFTFYAFAYWLTH